MDHNTIVATATPPGISALGIVRLSGPRSLSILEKIFNTPAGNFNSENIQTHTLHYGNIEHSGKIIDEVTVNIFKNPHSYTGEDMVEINCHGNSIILDTVMKLCIVLGAEPARPGEFSKRAFLNGKMDLSQAEAVNSLIHSRSKKSIHKAVKLVKGELKNKIEEIKDRIQYLRSRLNADIEWGDTETADFFETKAERKKLRLIKKDLSALVKNSQYATKILNGFRVVICGRPNAGKSSLFNLLLTKSRSIINKRPGTTRDVIESEVLEKGCLIRYFDTAGIGLETKTQIDMEASDKSKEAIRRADLVVYLIDGETGIKKKDYKIRNLIDNTPWIPVVNKIDRKNNFSSEKLDKFRKFRQNPKAVKISCNTEKNIDKLKEKIIELVSKNDIDGLMVTARQRSALQEAYDKLNNSLSSLETGKYQDMISYDLAEVIDALGKIDGTSVQKGMLDKIFDNFCIGK
ncbi:MAG: tRNA uridine-5-carboxymethylaminomethyl(34) synthesis GTPase MnmE [Elusimicrobiota bacterium]